MRTQLERAAAWIVGLELADVPGDVVALARCQQLDILASLSAGSRTQVGQALLRSVAAAGPVASDAGGPCRALPFCAPCSLLDAVYLHATLANALELDDFVFAGHTGQSAVGVPLALGQITGASGEQALLAQIAANEVAGRLGAVMTAGPQHGHMKAYLHRLGAAVAGSRLLGLDERRTANALAIALSNPEYPLFPASWSPDTKALCTGDPCVAGVRACFLAAEGLAPARDVLEHAVGLVTSLSEHQRVPEVWHSLGRTYSLQAICFKPVAACAYAAAAALAASRAIAGCAGFSAERVRSVEIQSNSIGLTLEGFSTPHEPGLLTPANTNFSTRRSVALTLLEGSPPVGASFRPERFAALRARLAELSERTRLSHHWPYTIELLRGVDAAIDHPGRPGIYGMGEAHKTLTRFRRAFGTPGAVTLADVPALLSLPRADRSYLFRRYAVGLRARLPFTSEAARGAYVSRETDLSRMQLRFASGVRIALDDGRILSEEVCIPDGFAGDPEREQVPRRKFRRELSDAFSPAFAERMLAVLTSAAPPSPSALVASWEEGLRPEPACSAPPLARSESARSECRP